MHRSEHHQYEHAHTHTKSTHSETAPRLTTTKGNLHMKFAAALAIALSALTAGCVNSSTLQTAKALDPGQQRILVGGGFYASPSVNANASESTNSDVSLALPY